MVEVDVPNPAGKLMPGSCTEVHFALHGVGASSRRFLQAAILFQAAGPQVAVVKSKQQIEPHQLVLGRDLGGTMEITGGITPQDEIVANPPDFLIDGMSVAARRSNDAQSTTK